MAGKGYNGVRLAGWWRRVAAHLIDTGLPMLVLAVFAGFTAVPQTRVGGYFLLIIGVIAWPVFTIVNKWVWQGRTGRTFGKRLFKIRLVRLDSGMPTGIGTCIGRWFAHYIDRCLFYLGYFAPLMDVKSQTIADMICSTVVVMDRKQLRPNETSWKGAIPTQPFIAPGAPVFVPAGSPGVPQNGSQN